MDTTSPIGPRQELSKKIFKSPEAVRKSLRPVFNNSINELESFTETQISTEKKQKIWRSLIKILNKAYRIECCEQVLGKFKEEDILLTLKEIKTTGGIQKISNRFAILNATKEKARSVGEAVAKKQRVSSTSGF